MAYEGFKNSKNKIRKIWENSQQNSDNIQDNIKKINIDYLSVTEINKIPVISIIDDQILVDQYGQFQIQFDNFPDWAVNMSKPNIFFRLDSAYDIEQEVESFFVEFANGTLKTGDISIIPSATRVKHWWTKVNSKWNLNLRISLNVRSAIVSNIGFSTVEIPVYVNAKLYINNERFYDAIQSGK